MNDPLSPMVHRMVEAIIGETPRVVGGPRCGMTSAGVGVASGVHGDESMVPLKPTRHFSPGNLRHV